MELVNLLINTVIGWVNKLIEIFEEYSGSYSKFIVFGFLAVAFAKIFKVKLNLNLGKK